MIKSIFKEKIIYIFIITVILLILLIGKSNAQETTYTRKQMQEMLVSTALSLYYNNYFSDYGQRAMDSLGISGNYFTSGNLLWRDLNITPEEIGYSKYYHIDCTGFTFLIYKNTIGYDMSEYNVINRFLLFDKNKSYPITRVSSYSGTTRLQKFREAYEKFGYGYNTAFLAYVARKAANNCGDSNCTKLKESTSTKPFIYNNISGKDKNEIVYYFEARAKTSLDTVKSYYATAEAALQPGDIIVYSRYVASANEVRGHAMFYAGDDIMTSSTAENGFTDLLLHSTTNGGGDYTSSATSKNNKLYKNTSIISSSAKDYIDGQNGLFETVYKSEGNYVTRFMIIRPLNTICESDTICKISNNSFNVSLNETQLNNNEARVSLKKTQVQQYMALEKKYNNQTTIISDEESGYTENIISEYNSVNVGDTIVYKLQLKNKFDQENISNIKLEATIPENATYITGSCDNSCHQENNKLIWNNISLTNINEMKEISFKVKPKSEGKTVFSGYKIIKDDKTLQLSSKSISVMPTQNGINKEILQETVNKFQMLVNNGQINYSSNGNHTTNMTDLNELLTNENKTISPSSLGYIKLIYYNAFGFDLDMLTGEENILNTVKIINAVFDKVSYPERNNLSSVGADGQYPLIDEAAKTPRIFAKKTETDNEKLTEHYKLISKMVVPGLYGGKHLKGNDNNDRTKFLRSFYNNGAYQSDLEVGDIIISYSNDDVDDYSVYLYLGDDEENGSILTRFTISSSNNPLFLYHTDKYLTEYYQDENLRKKTTNKPSSQILNELFSKDLFIVFRPSRLGTTIEYDYNGGIQGADSYVAYTKYKNLITPKKENSQLTLINSKGDNITKTKIHTGTSIFDCWTSDETMENCITSNSDLVETERHTIYAKWNETTITLPKYSFKGYTHTGWYSDEALTKKVANVNEEYQIEKNETLYAKWIPIDYKITYNLDGGTLTNSKTSYNIETNTFTITNPTKKGYIFVGWIGSNLNTPTNVLTIEKGSTGDKVYTATWIKDFKLNVKDYDYNSSEKTISNILINTTKEQLLNKITITEGYTIKTNVTDKVYTGSKIQIYYEDTLLREITNIVLGDVNGDGNLSIFDIVKINNHIIDKTKHLSSIYYKAADYNNDGELSIFDIVKINKKIIE